MLFVILGVNILLIGLVSYLVVNKPKVAYIDISKTYSEFALKKKLELKLKNVEGARKMILDSLELQLNSLSALIQRMDPNDKSRDNFIQDFELRKQDFYLKQKNFTENNEATAAQYDQQIWKQINQYVKEYGEENDYEYIFGSDGTGTLMYSNEMNDITAQVKDYVNKKYKGSI